MYFYPDFFFIFQGATPQASASPKPAVAATPTAIASVQADAAVSSASKENSAPSFRQALQIIFLSGMMSLRWMTLYAKPDNTHGQVEVIIELSG